MVEPGVAGGENEDLNPKVQRTSPTVAVCWNFSGSDALEVSINSFIH